LEGPSVFPDVISYGIVLNRLTIAMYDDWRILEICRQIWKQAAIEADIEQYMEPFDKAKLALVEDPIAKFIDYHKTGVVPETFGEDFLYQNISVAVLVDQKLGNSGNVYAGNVLAANNANSLGAGPTRFSDNGKSILFCMPLPEDWANLYSTWNLAFISQYEHFPYVMMKLLIPKVLGYHNNPDEYIYNRALALHTHLYYAYLGRADREGAPTIQWHDSTLMTLWGDTNKASAIHYEGLLDLYF
jgi:hypothetical protein